MNTLVSFVNHRVTKRFKCVLHHLEILCLNVNNRCLESFTLDIQWKAVNCRAIWCAKIIINGQTRSICDELACVTWLYSMQTVWLPKTKPLRIMRIKKTICHSINTVFFPFIRRSVFFQENIPVQSKSVPNFHLTTDYKLPCRYIYIHVNVPFLTSGVHFHIQDNLYLKRVTPITIKYSP